MSKRSAKRVRILLIDEHTLFRESLARLLQAEEGFEVVAGCKSGAEALEILKSHEVDMILLDLGAERGTDFLDRLRDESFKGNVLLVTADVDERQIPNLIRKGISGIFMKRDSPELLIQGICEAMEGRVLFERDVLRRALESAVRPAARQNAAELTDRERCILSLIFEGLTNKEIAYQLQLSESAVKACLQQLFAKTGVRTRSQLVRIAMEQYRNQLP